MAVVDDVLTGLDRVRSWQEETYRDLHRHPELSHEETRTAGIIADRLAASGYEVHRGIGGTGVVGVLATGPGPVVLLRADMDALPVRERSGLPYASSEVSDDGEPVMHACGHDVHVTCLLGAAQLLAEGAAHWHGTLVALFQPAEEAGDGAAGMVADGLADLNPGARRRLRPARARAAGRHGGHVPRGDLLRRGQHANHDPRSWGPRFDATIHGRSGRGGGDGRGAAADHRGAGDRAHRGRRRDGREPSGGHGGQRDSRRGRPGAECAHVLRRHPSGSAVGDPPHRGRRERGGRLPEPTDVRGGRPLPAHLQRRR